MDLRSRLEALKAGSPPSEDPAHARLDAVLRSLATEGIDALRRVLDRWVQAGYRADSAPDPTALEADDTGNVIDPDTKALIAMPEEWTIYERVYTKLKGRQNS
jgi:hypothetical protein